MRTVCSAGHDFRLQSRRRGGFHILAIVLAVLAFFSWRIVTHSEPFTMLLIGAILIAVGVSKARQALLVPGGILLGIGAGGSLSLATRQAVPELSDAARLIGLAGAFGVVYLLSGARRPHGRGVMWAAGLALFFGVLALLSALGGAVALTWRMVWSIGAWWPLVLIVAGVILIVTRFRHD